MLDKLQKRVCRTVGSILAASLEPVGLQRNVARLNLFYMHYLGRCSSELVDLVPLRYSHGRSTYYFDKLILEFSACKMLSSDLSSKMFYV